MRLRLRELCAFAALAALSGCTCVTGQTDGLRFACRSNEECAEGFVCRGGECRSENQPPGACQPTDPPRSCSIAGCQQTCGADGGFGPCAPASGGSFDTNPAHCGECGRSCSDRLGASLTCIGARCTCVLDSDCPAGLACNAGGLCVLDSDSCANVDCPFGEVCRNGLCGVEPCAAGCGLGEVCDSASNNCRPIGPCRLPTACADGGYCEGDPKPDGVACDDGVACTHSDRCVAGSCTGTTYTCAASACLVGAGTCTGDGGCSGTARPDGTLCDDGAACTHSDSCVSGNCSGTSYTCTAGACEVSSVCGGDGGCVGTNRADDTPCDDGNLCTQADVCTSGSCAGTGYACPPPTTCQAAVACNGDGGCLFTNKDAGASCDDGVACTTNDVCDVNQNCAGTAATTYLDADGDGRGDSNFPQNVCPTDGGWVIIGGDCNDSDPDVSQVVNDLVRDLDRDRYTTGSAALICVGSSQLIDGGTYYKDTSGQFTWLGVGESLGTDCLDSDADVYMNLASSAVDADNDGYYVGSLATNCVGSSTTINARLYYRNASGVPTIIAAGALDGGECNDADPDVFRSLANVGADVDQDGYYALSPPVGTQCVGAQTTGPGGRTYYANASGAFTWIVTSGLTTDCNDADPATSGPFPWYVDADGDGRGAGTGTVSCSSPGAQYVTNNSDCNDSSINVFQTVASLVADVDRDFYGSGTAAAQCVGNVDPGGGGRYMATTGAYTWLPSTASLGADCLDSDADIFTSLANSAVDADNDGYYVGSLATNCVGSSTTINTRLYYRNASGVPTFIAAGALGGSECNDADPDIFRTIANLGPDADQDGYLATSPAVGSQCVGTSFTHASGRVYYRDALGNFTWLTAPGLGNDCNDANASIQGAFNWYFDSDGDTFGGATTQVSCASPGAGWVTNNADCNDSTSIVFQSLPSLVVDADQDGYRLSTSSPATQCVGQTLSPAHPSGRTYFRDIGGSYFWVSSTSAPTTDCNDGSAAVTGPSSWYVDNDLDGRGTGTAIVQCSSPGANYVTLGGDCNDADIDVYRTVSNLLPDNDRDGYTTGTAASQCVGDSQNFVTPLGLTLTYYENASASFVWLPAGSSQGTDCNNGDRDVWFDQNNLIPDFDNDGYPANDNPVSACVGLSTTIGGRTYYNGTSGTPDWLFKNDCIGRSGNTCPYIDCYDLNGNARFGQTAYFTVNRGDGSYDYDCSGTIQSNTSGTYCASVSSSVNTYTDGTCVTVSGTASICNSPTAYALPGACGRTLSAGTSAFVFSGVCTTATRAGATVVGCR